MGVPIMSSWTDITDNALEPGKPIRSIDAFALRNNPIAIAGGAAGAPRILDAALSTDVTTAGEDWVMARTAQATALSVGAYFFGMSSVSLRVNATISGGFIFTGGIVFDFPVDDEPSFQTISIPSNFNLHVVGTLRCMGELPVRRSYQGTTSISMTLFLRIA